MNIGKFRRRIWIVITISVAILYILLNKDIVKVLEESSLQTQLGDVAKIKGADINKVEAKTIATKVILGLFLGSNKNEVVSSLGKPSIKEEQFLNQWYYGESILYFDSEDKINGYKNFGELSESLNAYLALNHPESLEAPLFIGSDKKLVMTILGAPSMIDPLHPDSWKYSNSTIHFTREGSVDGYLNYLGEIDDVLPKAFDTYNTFQIGSTKEDVMSVMGPPSSIENYHPNIWIYKLAKVYFDEDGFVKEVDDGFGDLKFVKSRVLP